MWKTHDGSALSDPSCKLARPNEMKHIKQKTKDSFNYVTHPHSRSLPPTVLLVCRNGHCEEQWSRKSLAARWMARSPTRLGLKPFLCSKKPPSSPKYRSRPHRECHTRAHVTQTSHKPAAHKTIDVRLSAAVLRGEKRSFHTHESSDVSYTPKDTATHRYGRVQSIIYKKKKKNIYIMQQGRFWNATSFCRS